MAKPAIITVDDEAEVLRAVERDLRRKYAADYIVRKHRGNIRFETKPGDTCFQVRLPLLPKSVAGA